MRFRYKNLYFWILLVAVQLLIGCNVTKHLNADKGERILSANTLKFTPQSKLSLSKRQSLKYETSGLFRQQANKRFLRSYPRLAAYYKYQGDSSRFAHFVNKQYAQMPSIFDEKSCQISANYFQNFMRKRGYFNAICTYSVKEKSKHEVEVTYLLDTGPLYTIASVALSSKDTTVLQLLRANAKDSELKPGKPMSEGLFASEKNRIVTLLRNKGYAQMIPNYIEFSGDSLNTKVSIGIEVLPFSEERIAHPVFTIGNVTVFSSLVPDVNTIRNDPFLNGIKYFSNEEKFFIKPKHLDKAIKVRPGDLYAQQKIDESYRKMSNMGAFRFVSVRPKPDSIRPDTMNVDIYFAPAKKMSFGPSADLRYISQLGLLGVPVSVFFKHRNLFHGAELLQTSLTGNVEFQISGKRTNPIFLWEGKLQNSLVIPRFFDYCNIWQGLHHLHFGKIRIVSDNLYRLFQTEAPPSTNHPASCH